MSPPLFPLCTPSQVHSPTDIDQAAEALLARSTGREALDNAIKAAELYMEAASQAATKAEGLRFRRRCQELIAYAEKLKVETNPRLALEDSILKDAANLHGNNFPAWRAIPSDAEFQVPADGELFRYTHIKLAISGDI